MTAGQWHMQEVASGRSDCPAACPAGPAASMRQPSKNQEAIPMTTSPRATPGRKLWHVTLRAARALQALHDEQAYMWELFWQTSRVPVDQAGPLTWTPSLDGPG